jgi:hypothetical protein
MRTLLVFIVAGGLFFGMLAHTAEAQDVFKSIVANDFSIVPQICGASEGANANECNVCVTLLVS